MIKFINKIDDFLETEFEFGENKLIHIFSKVSFILVVLGYIIVLTKELLRSL